MNMPLVLLNRRRRGGFFSPYSLFSGTAIGTWFDPSDLSTMYQDAAGTTAVTTPGQPVGLRLDKSKGLALGAELVANGDFSAGTTGWTGGNGATIAVVSSALVVTKGAGSYPVGGQTLTGLTVGRAYRFTCSFVNALGLDAFLGFGGFAITARSTATSGTMQCTLIATATSHDVNVGLWNTSGASGQSITFDNISVRELPGNHAVQSVLASRPVYGIEPAGGRRNLLTYSEDLSNAAWVAVGTNATATKGSVSTDRFDGSSGSVNTLTFSAVPSITGSYAIAYQLLGAAYLNTAVSYSVWLRVASGTATVYLNVEDSAAEPTGGNFFASPALTLTTAWQRFTVTGTRTSGAGNAVVSIGFDTRAGAGQTNAASLTVQVGGAQLELNSTATAYQRVGTAFDVTEAGVQSCHYVQYDGSDDGMITNSIDFTATDKMSVFAGVRKLSDAAAGVFFELSANVALNAGSFYMTAPETIGAGGDFAFKTRGSVNPGAFASSGTMLAPTTRVLTGVGDIPADLAGLRVNGGAQVNYSADQGTGTFGNYPLYLGRRGGTTLPFFGRDYGIVVVGKATTADEITSTERWLSGKTGFYAPVITGVPTIGVS